MDIRKWLDETVLPKQPLSPPEQPSLPRLRHSNETKQTHGDNRTRRHSTSDSSLLDTRPRRRKAPPIEPESNVEDGACSDASDSEAHSSGSSASSQKYARRPRRKTRPERYDPTAKDVKERGRQTHRRRKDESKKSKPKPRPKKGDKPGTGKVQSFHAKNVPRDRLTLKPREKLGIFNKGRASSPVKGRGLPDLVFSEMKFLQKQKDQPEDVPKAGLPKKKHKKDHTHVREEEISAYFTTVRPALAEKDVNTQAKKGTPKGNPVQDMETERDISAGVDNIIPTVELPDKASYLGFGSRGPRHESGSYISWSESIRAPSVTPLHTQAESIIGVGQLDTIHGRRDGRDTNGGDVSHSRVAPLPAARHATDGSGSDGRGRFGVSSLAPANHRLFSRSHSLLQHTSSPRTMNLVNRAVKDRACETVPSPSSMPPSIPHRGEATERRRRHTHAEEAIDVNGVAYFSNDPKLMRRQRDIANTDSGDKETEDVDAATSSSLGRILQECNTTFDERHHTAGSYENRLNMAPPARSGIERTLRDIGSYRAPQRITTVRFAGGDSSRPMLRNVSGRSIYEDQERREQYLQQTEAQSHGLIDDSYLRETECLERGGETAYDVRGWDDTLLDQTESHQMEFDMLGEDYAEPYEMEHGEQRMQSSEDVVGRGFWRPHKLY